MKTNSHSNKQKFNLLECYLQLLIKKVNILKIKTIIQVGYNCLNISSEEPLKVVIVKWFYYSDLTLC